MPDALRLALGTFTRVPVPAPRRVDRRTAGLAMLSAPLIGILLALVIGGVVQLAVPSLPAATTPFLVSALALAAIAYATRGLHLDGLADTADALGSGRPAPEALEIARRSDIGPFGVLAIVFVLLVDVAAYAGLVTDRRGLAGLLIALGSGRLAATIACTRGIPAARPDGLGAAVAETVPGWATAVAVGGWLILVSGLTVLVEPGRAIPNALAVLAALACGGILVQVCVRRLGGITGDVLGATIELAACAALVILVAVPY